MTRSLLVKTYMTPSPISVPPNTELQEVDQLMRDCRISSLPITKGTVPVGIISRTDLLRVARREASKAGCEEPLRLPVRAVEDIMSTTIWTVAPATSLEEAATKMLEHKVHRVYVCDDDNLVGVLSVQDLMAAVSELRIEAPVSRYMSSPVLAIRSNLPVTEAIDRLTSAEVSGLIVTHKGWPVGIFTQREAIASQHVAATTATENLMSRSLAVIPPSLPMWRAAAHVAEVRVRRSIAVQSDRLEGILTGLDFARALVDHRKS